MRPFDVQLIGGMVLHSGKISEMKTGEGKTLVATMPVYLNALMGRGVHVVVVTHEESPFARQTLAVASAGCQRASRPP